MTTKSKTAAAAAAAAALQTGFPADPADQAGYDAYIAGELGARHVAATKAAGDYTDDAWDALALADRHALLSAVPADFQPGDTPDDVVAEPDAAPEAETSAQTTPPPEKPAAQPARKSERKAKRQRATGEPKSGEEPPAEPLVVVELKTSRYSDTRQQPLQRGQYARTTARRAAGMIGKKKAIHVADEKLEAKAVDVEALPVIA